MSDIVSATPSVVVGIDGSRAAVDAALWAVDDAVSRDMPLRLVYAIDPPDKGTDTPDAARDLATAELAVRYAFTAVESTEKPVKIEVEIAQARPTRALLDAARSATMICVGARGLRHATQGRIGSTAAAVANSAHCPVAIIRGRDSRPLKPGWIVAEVDGSTDGNVVLQRGFEEAMLRGAPLRVLTTWQSKFTDIHDSRAVTEANRQAKAQLDRRLAAWKKRYPAVDVRAVAAHGNTLNHLAKNAKSIQLVVVGRERVNGVSDLVGPAGYAVLHNTDCSVLICEPQRG
jgi:nucleotide-binding universal stress UspA family protein